MNAPVLDAKKSDADLGDDHDDQHDDAATANAPMLPLLRTNFHPNEVTFCDLSDDDDGFDGGDYDDDDDDDDDYDASGCAHLNGISNDDTRSVSTSTCCNRRPNRSRSAHIVDMDADSILSTDYRVSARPAKPQIPDGGYGWVVVFASLVVSLIADGISFSFGLLYTEFLLYFGESNSKTAWIGSIFLAVPLLSGPVMSNLVDRYGCQRMTIIGGVLSGIGFVLAAMSNSVAQLYWTFGVVGGLGLGIGYVTAVCSVVGWFDKRRTFATGIGASGTGIGTFLYAPLTQYLIEAYGWRGTCLILAGTLFNICVCGCLMLDPEWLIESNRLESRSQSMKTFSNSSVCLDEIKKLLEDGAPNDMVLDTLVTSYNTEVNQQTDHKESTTLKKYHSLLLLPTYYSVEAGDADNAIVTGCQLGSRRSLRRKLEEADAPRPFEECPRPAASVHHLTVSNNNNNNNINSKRLAKVAAYEQADPVAGTTDIQIHLERASAADNIVDDDLHNDCIIEMPGGGDQALKPAALANKSVLRNTASIKNANYLRNMRFHRNSIHYRGAMLSTHRYRLRTSSCPNIYRNSMTTLALDTESTWLDGAKETLKSIFDFSLFLNPKFAYFEISTVLLFIWFIVPYFYLPEHMLKHGYVEDDSAFIISVIGVSQTIGMISLGYIGDKPWLNVPKTYAGCLVVCGISVAAMPMFTSSYVGLSIVGAIFGLMFASSFSFTPIILVQLVSLDDFTCAYGLVLLIQGVGNLVGPPISGLMFEWFGVWDHAFYASGFFIALAGVFVYITGILQDRDPPANEEDN